VARIAASLFVAAALLGLAAPAAAAPTPAQQIAALQKQVRTLQKQVRALRLEVEANYVGDACLAASTADIFQSTWATVDDFVEASHAPRLFGTPPFVAVSDKGACLQGLKIQRQQTKPPTTTVFQALINWLV
jgi:hypothetical protein